MATFAKTYIEAAPNTPILSSAWNENIDATKERFETHDHSGSGESGQQIRLNGLADEVKNEFARKEHFDTHNHSGGEKGLQIGKEGLDSVVNSLLDQVAELGKPAVISLSVNTGSVGANIIIKGINFVAPVKVFFGSVEVPNTDVGLLSNTTISAKVPSGGEGNVTVETNFGAAASVEEFVLA